jgi:PHD/YefM family antitoxin component YafN of YafNO toxin-antitoxin module
LSYEKYFPWSDMNNTLTAAALKRRGMAAIEERLRHGPVHLVKRNRPAAVVLSEEEYLRLTSSQPATVPGLTALQWLLNQPAAGTRSKQDIDQSLAAERSW